jgi:6-pyruvoyltetrahydropterin/6-carboxytetrahydropterin synthase
MGRKQRPSHEMLLQHYDYASLISIGNVLGNDPPEEDDMSGKFGVTKQIDFCYGHRLMDFVGDCSNLHGHNARIEVVLESETLDNTGFVTELGEVKKAMKGWIDKNWDHGLVLRQDDPLIPALEAAGMKIYKMKDNPTTENMARLVFAIAVYYNLPVVTVRFWETFTNMAEYSGTAEDVLSDG